MHHSRNIQSDLVFDALNLNNRKSAHDSSMRVPSLAVFKPSALIFITDAKEPTDENRQKRPSKYARIREFVRRPKEQSRKTSQARIRTKLQKSIGVIKGVGMSKGERLQRRSGYAEKVSGVDAGSGSGSGSRIRRSAAVADATTTSTTTTATATTTTTTTAAVTERSIRSTSTFCAEKSKANTATTTVLYLQ
ncbi:hypothetical protein F5Y11DRAFT_352172 [Daldinia sp. FL1419]|nr:hypothetical protein F5Y11DRAFT_352172 [Daldinia sp. FL1419]